MPRRFKWILHFPARSTLIKCVFVLSKLPNIRKYFIYDHGNKLIVYLNSFQGFSLGKHSFPMDNGTFTFSIHSWQKSVCGNMGRYVI